MLVRAPVDVTGGDLGGDELLGLERQLGVALVRRSPGGSALTESGALVTEWARDHLTELQVTAQIRTNVTEGIDKQQREFLLRRQLEAVRKELRELNGEREGEESDDYRARVEAADLPEKVRAAALKEVDKLERASDQSPESSWIRTWLDTVLEMPWHERTEDQYDIQGARAVLDAEHAGLGDVKERITEYLAVRKRRAERGLGVVGGRRGGGGCPLQCGLVCGGR